MLSYLFLCLHFVRLQLLNRLMESGSMTQETLCWSGPFFLLISQTAVVLWNLLFPQLIRQHFSPYLLDLLHLVLSALKLKQGFYNETCPGVEQLVREELEKIFADDSTIRAGLLRLHFHDCFVRGCDASLMLESRNGTAEKHADPNLTVRGYEVIEKLKLKVEALCPLVVSCADLMAIAARDAVKFSEGPDYPVETGRRDGNISMAADAKRDLPPADGDVATLTRFFAAKNLTMKDLVVLSGAHTLGVAHCPSFSGRVHNHTGAGDADPALDAAYLQKLNATCGPANVASVVPLDAETTDKFDLGYYQSVHGRKGLLGSDDALNHDSLLGAYVELMNNASSLDTFFADFAVSMVNMGRVGVLTGEEGEIRDTCGIFVD